MRKVVIIGPPPVQVLDVTGPLEVFSNAPDYEIQLANPGLERVLQTNRGVVLAGATPIADVRGPIDTLVIAGGPGAECGSYAPNFINWIAKVARQSRRVRPSVPAHSFSQKQVSSTGSKPSPTGTSATVLPGNTQKVIVRPEPIYLRDGAIYTSAGITAGIDLSLALVEEDHGHETALRSRASSSCTSCVRADRRNTATCSRIRPLVHGLARAPGVDA